MHAATGSGPWKVGELAKITGITVRALHHYDEIGLLRPTHHTDAGHRLYSHRELERLQQIVTLRHLGLSLEQISEAMDHPGFSPLKALQDLRGELRSQRLKLEELESRLNGIEENLHREEVVSAKSLIEVIERIIMLEKYLTQEQMNKVNEIEKSYRPERVEEMVKVEWPTLISEVQKEIDNGTPPSSPRARELAQRWMKLVSEKTGGDAALGESYRRILQSEPAFAADVAAKLGHPQLDFPKLMDYMSQALKAGRST